MKEVQILEWTNDGMMIQPRTDPFKMIRCGELGRRQEDGPAILLFRNNVDAFQNEVGVCEKEHQTEAQSEQFELSTAHVRPTFG